MFEQQHSSTTASSSLDCSAAMAEWLDTWPGLRAELVTLTEEYVRCNPCFERRGVEWLIEEIDTSLRILKYRVEWLQERLIETNKPL